EREREIRRIATTDRETELPNRAALEAHLEALRDADESAVLIAVGVERYAPIRDAIGYRLAADLTRLIGRRLAAEPEVEIAAVVSTGMLAAVVRASGDDRATAVAGRLQALLEKPIELGDHKIDVMVAMGLARASGDHDVIDRATIALEQARAGRVGAMFFDGEAYGDPARNLSLIGDLIAGMERGEVTVAYQPKYDLRGRRAIGVEALVRWSHPERGFVSPDAFIALAEETGRIGPVTLHVMRHALDAQAVLSKHGFDLTMSINLSGRLLGDPAFEAALTPLITRAVGPVCFEITETAVIDDPETGIAAVERYAQAGVQISIDDYGSGLSSLAYLKQIPAQELKIDKAFVLEVETNARDALLVRSTVDLAHSLGMKVTAEGVETLGAAALLAGMGCDVGQGYGLGRPMPIDALIAHLQRDPSVADPSPSPDVLRA
ncbi:MAG: GGDEF domain-containing phosphodiesterase, partial [Caulobacterales bacterium]|nr:GGDEF domain-containing phosphodiesterase [Caulobacterales bacterium]